MNKLFITAALLIVSTIAMCQTTPVSKPEVTIWVKMTDKQLLSIQQLFGFAFQWLPKSSAPAIEVEGAKAAMQQIFPILIADTTKKTVIKK